MEPAETLTVVLQTLDYPPDAGLSAIGLYTHELARSLAARGHRVHVVARGADDAIDLDGDVTVHRVAPPRPDVPTAMRPLRFLAFAAQRIGQEITYRRRLARRLADLVRGEGADLVEACDSSAEALLYPSHRPRRVPFVVRLHMPTFVAELFDENVPATARRLIQYVERRMLLRSTHASAPTAEAAVYFRRVLALGDRPIAVYPNPPTIDAAGAPARRPSDGRTVLYVGRLTVGKGAVAFAEAIPHVIAAHPQARFTYVGPDGPTTTGHASMRAHLLDLVPPEHRAAVTFAGHVAHDEVAERIQDAAVCVFPSAFESFGYACLEAMALGKAIVASDTAGLRHLLDGGRCGLLFPFPDARRLAEQLLRLLRDPELRLDLGDRARERAATVFGSGTVTDQIERFYRQAVADVAGASR